MSVIYYVRKKKGVTVLQGIKNVAGPDVEVIYEKGVNLSYLVLNVYIDSVH